MNVDGSDVRRISPAGETYYGSPTWSHDGKRIAFDGAASFGSFNKARIYVQTLGEDKPQDLGPGNTPAFSPDDRQVAFFMQEGNAAGEKAGVWIMNADGTNREWLSGGARPRWSPDGDKLVFFASHEGFASLYVYDTVSLERTRILDKQYDGILGAAWSPEGNQFVLIGSKNGQNDVAIVDVTPGSKPKTVQQGQVGWHPDWSPQGGKIVFRISNGGAELIHILDLDGEGKAVPLPNQSGRRNSDAQFSPDGKQLAFSSDRG